MTMLVTLSATLVTVRVAQPKTPNVTAVPPNEVRRAPPMAFLSGGRCDMTRSWGSDNAIDVVCKSHTNSTLVDDS